MTAELLTASIFSVPVLAFAQGRAPGRCARGTAGQHESDQDAGDLHDRQQRDNEPLVGDGACLEEDECGRERDKGCRSVVRGHGTAIDRAETGDAAQYDEREHWDHDPQCDGGANWSDDIGK